MDAYLLIWGTNIDKFVLSKYNLILVQKHVFSEYREFFFLLLSLSSPSYTIHKCLHTSSYSLQIATDEQ